MNETEQQIREHEYEANLQKLQELRPIDDEFMRCMFKDNIPLAELVLRIDSIEFVAGLPKLQYLNITDNNVTSLKPLEGLSDFQAVWCGQNTILENLPESSGISVYTTEY